MKTIRSILAVILVSTVPFIQNQSAQGNGGIHGRVIDGAGRPIANALVYLSYPPCRGCGDQIIESMVTSEEGVFFQEMGQLARTQGVRLIIEEGICSDYYKLIYNPDLDLAHIPEFRGISINPRKDRNINLGDVLPTIRYKQFSFDLAKYADDSSSFSEMKFSVRDSHRKILVRNRRIPSGFWQPPSVVKLALPFGQWFVDVSYFDRRNKLRSKHLLVKLEQNEARIQGAKR